MNKLLNLTISALIGLVFIGLGASQLWSTVQKTKSDMRGTGQVVGVSSHTDSRNGMTYSPVVEFQTPDGTTHRFVSNIESSTPPVIGTVETVLYNPTVPEDALIDNPVYLYVIPWIIVSSGMLVIFLFCILPSLISLHQERKAARLRSIGRPVQAQIIGAERTNVKVNRVRYYRIKAQWLDTATNTMHIFYSFSLPFDPTSVLQGATEATVYINPSNQKDYWMDTRFLPKVVT